MTLFVCGGPHWGGRKHMEIIVVDQNRAAGSLDPERSANTAVAAWAQVIKLATVIESEGRHAMLPIALTMSQVCAWTGLGKTKLQELVNRGDIATAKVDGRTLVLTNSVIAMIERCRVRDAR